MRSPKELEDILFDPNLWDTLPIPPVIREMANTAASEGVFTGITWDENLGWTILQKPDNGEPYIAWCQARAYKDMEDMDYDV